MNSLTCAVMYISQLCLIRDCKIVNVTHLEQRVIRGMSNTKGRETRKCGPEVGESSLYMLWQLKKQNTTMPYFV